MAERSAAGFAFVVSRESRNLATTVAPSDAAHPHGTTRRDFLYLATGAGAVVGAAALAWPFVASMAPDAETVAAGAPIDVDLGPITEGQIINVFWRGKLIFVRRLTQKEIADMKAAQPAQMIDPAPFYARVKEGHDQWLVAYGNCTHLGCVPIANQGGHPGWGCPCHGSMFDAVGRVTRGPAPINLPLPPYAFQGDAKVRIGEGATA